MSTHTAGTGKSLAELHKALFGPSRSAKAFRALMKQSDELRLKFRPTEPPTPEEAALAGDAAVAIADLAGSQEFKALWKAEGFTTFSWTHVTDPVGFARENGWMLRDLKRWMDWRLGIPAKRFSKETSAFLREWVNTDRGRLPIPTREIIQELRPFRLETPRLCFRGIRFRNIGEMVSFHIEYAKGKSFPFSSPYFTSWSTDPKVAERFGRYNSAVSKWDAMSQWIERGMKKKDYSGRGGYLIGARVRPEQCLVDLAHEDLPEFGFASHGNEGEVILLPNVEVTAKVYNVFGDAEREVQEFQGTYEDKPPTHPQFFGYLGSMEARVNGDAESGEVVLTITDPDHWTTKGKTPRQVAEADRYDSIMSKFNRAMYDARWVSDDTIRYRKMTLPQRVAARHLRGF